MQKVTEVTEPLKIEDQDRILYEYTQQHTVIYLHVTESRSTTAEYYAFQIAPEKWKKFCTYTETAGTCTCI